MQPYRNVLQNSFFNLIAAVSQRIGQTIIFILIARSLPLTQAGAFKLSITYASILFALSLWGLEQLLIRDVARDQETLRPYVNSFLMLRLALSITLWLGFALALNFFPYNAESKRIILIMALTIVPDSIADIYKAVWIGLERVKTISIIIFVASLFRLVGGALLLGARQPVETIGYLFVATSTVELFVLGLFTHRALHLGPIKWSIDISFWRKNLREATPLIIVSFVLLIEYQFDDVILSFFWPESEVGVYGAAVIIFTLLLLIVRSFQLAVFPVLSRAHTGSPERLQTIYSQILVFLILGSGILAAAITLVSKIMISAIYGPGFEEAAKILNILVWAFFLSALNVPHSRLLIVTNQQRIVAYFAIFSMVGNLALNFILVPRLGGIGTAWARLAAMPLFTLPAFFYVQKHICRFSASFLWHLPFLKKQPLKE